MTLRPSGPRAKRRWALLAVVVLTFTTGIVGAVLAAMPSPALFELDKDATNDNKSDAVGYLNTTIAASAAGGSVQMNVCQILAYGTAPNVINYAAPVAGETVLLRDERMTLTNNQSGNFGGNCAGTKQIYTVTRAAGSPQQKGGDNVTARISVLRTPNAAGVAGPDWNQIRAAVAADPTTKCTTLSLVECAFIEDGIGPSIFIGGNTKDHIDFPSWSHTTGGSPDKGEILNAYAAKAIAPVGNSEAGDQIIYFGMDRWAVDGSTDIGFWFLKNAVVACPDTNAVEACANVPAGSFAGQHAVGDILVLGTFTQGGATSQIRVFRWVGSGGNQASGTVQGPEATLGDCLPSGFSNSGCATVNNSTIEVWPTYTFKGDDRSSWAPAGGFFEGGINLTDLGLAGCFSTFIAETRSAPELTAVLKDFALGSFEACGSGLSTTPGDGTAGAGNVALTDHNANTIPDVSIGTGSVNVRDRAVLGVTGVDTWSGFLKFWLCGPDDLAPTPGKTATTCTVAAGGTQIGPAAGLAVNQTSGTAVTGGRLIISDSAEVTKAGNYCWRSQFISTTSGVPGATENAPGECFEVLPKDPSISTSATATVVSGGALDDTATLTGTANKPGSPVINPTTPGGPATGTITFKLYGPSATAVCNDSGANANLVGSSVVNVSGDSGTGSPPKVYKASGATVSGTFSPTTVGTYYWVASYSGDSPNTNAKSGACGDANETSNVVNANVEITPQDVTNEVNDDHVFTITSTAFPAGTSASFVSLAPSINPDISADAANYVSTCGSPVTPVGQPNVRTCTVTINSAVTGTFELNAVATWSFTGLAGNVVRSTSGTSGPDGSDSAIKYYVDANVAITPQQATNEVGTQHVFTITTTALPGSATPVSITSITPSLNPTIPAGANYSTTCGTPATPVGQPNVRTCTVTINSASAGTYELNATAVWSIDGVTVTRDTDTATLTIPAGPNGSDSAIKYYVDANVAITPQEATNAVGQQHVFTITSTAFPAGSTPTFVSIVPSITPDISADATKYATTCGSPSTPVGEPNVRTCTVTINSATAGKYELNAVATWSFSGLVANVVRSTGGNSGPNGTDSAIKYYVDAYITIGPDATNSVGDPHTFTVTVYQDDGRPAADPLGDGTTGFRLVVGKEPVSVALTGTGGAFPVLTGDGDECGAPGGTVLGVCDVTFTSATAGTVKGHASVTFTLDGVSLTRQTGADLLPNSVDATKIFVAGSIRWLKVYDGVAQGGATFSLCRTHTYNLEAAQGEDPFVDIDPDEACDTVVDNTGQVGYTGRDEDADPGEFLVTGKPLGRYEIKETVAPPGFELDLEVQFAEIYPGHTSVNLSSDPFVNRRPVLKVTAFGYTNEPTGEFDHGVVSGTTTYKVKLHNYGTATANLTGSSLVVSGNATCNDVDPAGDPQTPNTVELAGVSILAGADSAEYVLTCTYNDPNPDLIVATLTVKYLTNGVTREASGSPATISFTVHPADD